MQGPHDDDSEIINDDTNVSEVSSTACSDDLRRNMNDPTLDSDAVDEVDEADVDGSDDEDAREDKGILASPLLGVRGPKSISILDPKDCAKLIRVARNIQEDN